MSKIGIIKTGGEKMYRGDLERFLRRGEIPITRDREGDLYILAFSDCRDRYGNDYMNLVLQEIAGKNFDRFIENFSEFQ